MIISHKHKFIFLANGRTGTTSMYELLKKFDEGKFKKHTILSGPFKSVRIIDRYFDLSNYFVFCFVRNPWDRMLSMTLQWQKPIGLNKESRKYLHDMACGHSFTDFLKKVDESYFERWNQSSFYLLDGNLLDFVGRFENLQEDFNIICDKIGISRQQVPHKNKSKHRHYTEYYDDETRQIVAEKFAKDIEYFNYEF